MAILRQTIVDAIETRMKAITTVDGSYYTPLGSNVFMNRPRLSDSMYTPLAEHELPAVIVRDGLASYSEFTLGGKCKCSLSVEFEVRCEDGTDSADTVRKMITDVYKAIGTDPKWSGNALMTTPVSDDLLVLQADKIVGGALIKVTIAFITALWGES